MDEEEIFTHHSSDHLAKVWAVIASVGWYIFFVVIGLFFASPYLSEKYQSWRQKKDEKEYAAKYHKNPDLAEERLRGVEAARQRMQDEYRRAAEIAREKEEARKEAKRQELEKLASNLDGGQKLGTSSSSKLKSSFKDEYNPLMGETSRGYRAPKKSCCKKGGCG